MIAMSQAYHNSFMENAVPTFFDVELYIVLYIIIILIRSLRYGVVPLRRWDGAFFYLWYRFMNHKYNYNWIAFLSTLFNFWRPPSCHSGELNWILLCHYGTIWNCLNYFLDLVIFLWRWNSMKYSPIYF